MWWIQKNGRVEGPYSDEDIRKRISLNLVMSLDRVSNDGATWKFARDTDLWRTEPKEKAPRRTSVYAQRGVANRPSVAPPVQPAPLTPSAQIQVKSQSQSQPPAVSIVTEAPRSATKEGGETKRTVIFRVLITAAATVVVGTIISLLVKHLEPDKEKTKAEEAVKFASAITPAVAIVNCGGGSGTAFLLEMDGHTYLVSNEHVFRGTDMPVVTFADGEQVQLGEFSLATDRDMARFEVRTSKKPLRISLEEPVNNTPVIVYGNSGGGGVVTESKGNVLGMAKDRLEVSADIVPGNSGGPVVDASGNVLGVSSYIYRGGNGEQDWTIKGTRYDGATRKFALRFQGVNWEPIDREEYQAQAFAEKVFSFYCGNMAPYLFFEDGAEFQLDFSYDANVERDDFGFIAAFNNIKKTYVELDGAMTRYLNEPTKENMECAKCSYRNFIKSRRKGISRAIAFAGQYLMNADAHILMGAGLDNMGDSVNSTVKLLQDIDVNLVNADKGLDVGFEDRIKLLLGVMRSANDGSL